MTWGRADLQTRGHWLCELTVEGRVYRFSDQALTVFDEDGSSFAYEEGLSDIFVSPRSLAQREAQVTVTISSAVDWGDLVGRGVSLERQPAKLRRWWEGMTLEQSRVMLDGFTSDAVYETTFEVLEVAITRNIKGQSFPILGADAVVDEHTFPDVAGFGTFVRDINKIEGAFLPLVIGRPGLVPTGDVKPASPALLVQFSDTGGDTNDLMCIGIGKLECSDTTDGIRIYQIVETGPISETFTTVTGTTGIGQIVTLAQVGNPSTITVELGGEYWAAFRRTIAKGGVIDPATGDLLRGAGSVIVYLLREFTSEPLDIGRLQAVAERLDVVKIDTFINDGIIKPLEWIGAHLLSILPIEAVWGWDGLFYRMWRWDATSTEAIYNFSADDGGNCEQIGPVKPADSEIFNQFSLAFRHDRDKGRYSSRVFYQAEPDPNDPRKLASMLLARSVATYDVVQHPPLESAVLWDEPSAVQILTWKILDHAWKKRLVPVSLAPEWEVLEEGDIVTFTRTEAGIVNQPALVTALQIGSPSQIVAEFTLIDHPATTVHAV